MAGYAKLFGSILFSTIWGESKDVKILWVTMMAMADQDGMVEAAVPGLAAASRLTVAECRAAVAVLEAPDPDSKNPDHEGRRIEKRDGGWLLLNYAAYRDKLTLAHKREKTAERVRRFRERNAQKIVTAPALPAEPPSDHDGSPTETVIPLDLTTRAEKILPELLSGMKGVTLEQLRDGVREFVGYWTIGGGKFKRRNFWMKRLREDLRQKYEKGKLRAPGAIEHDEHKPERPKLSDGAERLIQMAKEEEAKQRRTRRVAAE
jgi:hypothetical protein